MVKEKDFQFKMGKLIMVSNIVIFVLVALGYVFKGFADDDEVSAVLKLLAPINSIYMAAVIKYMISQKNVVETDEETNEDKPKPVLINKGYATITQIIIYFHFVALVFLIGAKVLGAMGSIDTLTTSIAILETFFGAYVGTIIVDLFSGSKEN